MARRAHPRPVSRRRLGFRAALAVVIAMLAAWGGGFLWFVGDIRPLAQPRESAAQGAAEATDAIVVLTGGSERLAAGFALLAAKRAKKLFISGVYRGVEVAQLLRLTRRAPEDLECCVVLGYAASDTAGNARETAAWMAGEGFQSLRLVTAAYHMRRSLLEFRRAMPGATIVTHAVFPRSVRHEDWWRRRGTAILLATEYNKYLIALVRGARRSNRDTPTRTDARP